jgi:hypothetical protein
MLRRTSRTSLATMEAAAQASYEKSSELSAALRASPEQADVPDWTLPVTSTHT